MSQIQIQIIAVDEAACAAAIGMSLSWLRKDRRGHRRIPFFMLGDRVLYNLDSVRATLVAREQGGLPPLSPSARRRPIAEAQRTEAQP